MTSPCRIQLRRTAGWNKPKGAVVVARPSKWGNPFRLGIHGDAEKCVARYRALVAGPGSLVDMMHPAPSYLEQDAAFRQVRDHIHQLRGRDLCCWCALDAPCHADVLLALANRDDT